jgi:hypothetical protein
MTQHISLTAAHWAYVAGVVAVVLTMILRANVVVPSIVATFVVALAFTGSAVGALSAIFNASFVAAKELFNIFLVIALITALLNALKTLRSDVRMVQPFRVVMTNGHSAFFILAVITYVISLFFWPTPAVPLVSAVLLPAAIAAGLSPLAGAMAIAIAGQGMALSSDYVIGYQRQGGGRGRQCGRRRRPRAGAIPDHRRCGAGDRLFLDPQADQARQRGAARAMAEAVRQW